MANITGFVDTSKRRVTTTVQQDLAFSNQQTFAIAGALYTQTVAQTSTVAGTVTTLNPNATALNLLGSFAEVSACATGKVLNWLAQPDGAPAQGLLGQLSAH